MRVIAIIPARMGSSRFPGKPMESLHGMPMIGHCYHRTRLAKGIESVYVATCDNVIEDYVQKIGGRAVMTANSHTRATTRTAEALLTIEEGVGEKFDIVVMVQGDEPLIQPETISETIQHFDNPDVEIVNIMSRLKNLEQFVDKNNVKVVVDKNYNALYFSREPIPSPWHGLENVPMYMQTGVIAFRRDVLIRFNSLEETILEKIESVDMNRILENGGRIRMVPTEAETIGVDTPAELCAAEQLLCGDTAMQNYLNI